MVSFPSVTTKPPDTVDSTTRVAGARQVSAAAATMPATAMEERRVVLMKVLMSVLVC